MTKIQNNILFQNNKHNIIKFMQPQKPVKEKTFANLRMKVFKTLMVIRHTMQSVAIKTIKHKPVEI